MRLGEMSAVEPADEVNKEVGDSVLDCSLEMQGEDWLPAEINRNLHLYGNGRDKLMAQRGYRQARTLAVTTLPESLGNRDKEKAWSTQERG